MQRVVDDFIDATLDRVKDSMEDYATSLRYDLELYVSHLVRRAAKIIVLSLMGAVLISAGVVFSVAGLAIYLSQIMEAGVAWGVVGLGIILLGIVCLFPLARGMRNRNTDLTD